MQTPTCDINPTTYTFLTALNTFIAQTAAMPRFKGQTQALRALRRIANMAAFN